MRFTTALLLLFMSVASAQTITVNIPAEALADGTETVQLKINVIGGGVVKPPIPPKPTPTPVPGCKNKRAKVVNAFKSMEESYWRVNPDTVYAFKFVTPSGNTTRSMKFSVARRPGSDRSKLISVSRCTADGQVSPLCTMYDAEAASVNAYTNLPNKYKGTACELDPGTTYYANVYSKYRLSSTRTNCSVVGNPNGCAFLFNRK